MGGFCDQYVCVNKFELMFKAEIIEKEMTSSFKLSIEFYPVILLHLPWKQFH